MKNYAATVIKAFESKLIDEGQLLDAFVHLTDKQFALRLREDNLDGMERMLETEISEQISIMRDFIKRRNARLK